MQILGIDPGLTGGLVLLDSNSLQIVGMIPMPTVTSKHKEIDRLALQRFINKCSPDFIVLEQVNGRPGQSAKSTFTFGKVFGICLMAIAEYKHCLVPPIAWQKIAHQGIVRGDVPDAKRRSLIAANRLWPKESFTLSGCKKPHDGLVDAALIAYFKIWYNHV